MQEMSEHGIMDKIATDTGRKAFYNTNGIEQASSRKWRLILVLMWISVSSTAHSEDSATCRWWLEKLHQSGLQPLDGIGLHWY
jgi:hypothetical protein